MPFQPGNKLGFGKKGVAGRKPKSDEREMQTTLFKNFPPAKRAELIRNLAKLAIEEDNLDAAKILLSYTWGRPTETHKHIGDEEQPIVYKVRWPNAGSKGD